MASKRDDYIVIWPEYFDSTLSKEEGRRLPKSVCIPKPRANEIFQAAELAGLDVKLNEKKAHPRHWYRSSGNVTMKKSGQKGEILRQIAAELPRIKRE